MFHSSDGDVLDGYRNHALRGVLPVAFRPGEELVRGHDEIFTSCTALWKRERIRRNQRGAERLQSARYMAREQHIPTTWVTNHMAKQAV
jgi:hypothetical protein